MTDLNSTKHEYYEFLREHIEERISERQHSEVFTLEDIVVDEVWDQMSKGNRICAGIWMSRQVKNKRLPLICVGKINGNTNLYQSK